MPVTMACAKDLELIALREIRSLPGGEYVCHVEINPSGTDWTLVPVMRDGADQAQVLISAKTTELRLKQRYSVRFDW
ncbi:hypothetical protein [Bradyrhizobium sp. 33ap4]|uniref:hypothetical protein n=1 Tax=Bradyrhizobium sp. 33ap4 TaxID=3061630 RepID=UPI00292E3DA2|nr:hypothetical protein [Bradyrhizobium sp. 33ap4]